MKYIEVYLSIWVLIKVSLPVLLCRHPRSERESIRISPLELLAIQLQHEQHALGLIHNLVRLCYVSAGPHYGSSEARPALCRSFSPVGPGALTAGVLWLLEERISIRDVEIFAVGKIAESPRFSGEEDSSLQTAFPFYILAEGGDIVDGKRIGVLMECSGAERRRNDNRLIPYAH